MNKIFFYTILFFILVVYIYSIVFNAFPISTKIVLEGVGFLFCLKYIFNPNYKLKNEYKIIIKIVVLISIWDVFTSVANGQSEFHLIKYHLPALGSIFGAQMIYSYTTKEISKPEQILYLLVITIFAESVLSILMKFFPPIFDAVSQVLHFEFLTNSSIQFDLSRFIGIGNALFFGVLASCSLGVTTAAFLMNEKSTVLTRVLLIIMWVVISFTSFFTARWSITVIGLSLVLFVLNQKGKNVLRSLALVIGVCVIAGIVFVLTMNTIDDELYSWAFSFLTDPSTEDSTAEHMKDWWTNTHFELKTLLLGDALYALPNGKYYGGSDVGFFRQIYYAGIVGLGLNLWAHYKILRMTFKYRPTRSFKLFLSTLMFGYLAILVKGDATMLSFYIFILIYYSNGAFEKKTKRTSLNNPLNTFDDWNYYQ